MAGLTVGLMEPSGEPKLRTHSRMRNCGYELGGHLRNLGKFAEGAAQRLVLCSPVRAQLAAQPARDPGG